MVFRAGPNGRTNNDGEKGDFEGAFLIILTIESSIKCRSTYVALRCSVEASKADGHFVQMLESLRCCFVFVVEANCYEVGLGFRKCDATQEAK